MDNSKFQLDIWRLHPRSVRIEKAEKTLLGTAHPAGVKFCKPFSSANSAGWWIYPAVDIDIKWLGGTKFEHKLHHPYPPADRTILESLLRPADNIDLNKFCPAFDGRSKFTWGAVEAGVVQFWTGCIFKTPPGWNLLIRSPSNFPTKLYRVMEGVLETDWMQYDIWINFVFEKENEWVSFRANQKDPIAQLIPQRRESTDVSWEIGKNEILNRETAEANRVFEFFVNYNNKKFGMGGKQILNPNDPNVTKDSTAFYKMRADVMGKEKNSLFPLPHKIRPKPIYPMKKIKKRLFTAVHSVQRLPDRTQQ